MTAVKACAGGNVALSLMALVNYSPSFHFLPQVTYCSFQQETQSFLFSGHATDTGVKNVPASESAERVSAAYDKVGTFSEKTDCAVGRNTSSQTLHSEKEPRPRLRT